MAQSFWLQFAFWGLIQFNTTLIHSRIRMVIMIESPWNSLYNFKQFPSSVGQSPNVKMTPPPEDWHMMILPNWNDYEASCLLPMMLDDPSQCVLSRQCSMLVWWNHTSKQKLEYSSHLSPKYMAIAMHIIVFLKINNTLNRKGLKSNTKVPANWILQHLKSKYYKAAIHHCIVDPTRKHHQFWGSRFTAFVDFWPWISSRFKPWFHQF